MASRNTPVPKPDGSAKPPSHATLRQVAEACGVSPMTVSRALRGMPVVEARRAGEIRAKAVELGYRQNWALSRLMRATRLSSSSGYLETIAAITTGKGNHMSKEYQGLRQQAELLHFRLDEFTPKLEGITGRRMASILEARGIRGVILVPGEARTPTHYWLPSDRFICVLLGKSLRNHGMPRVQHDHYQAGIMAMNRLRRQGYRRPGLVIRSGFHERSWRSYAAAMAAYAPAGMDPGRAVCFRPGEEDLNPEALRTWLRRFRPDSVLVENSSTAQILLHLNGALGLVVMNASPEDGHWAGVVQQNLQIGREAIHLLAGRLFGEYPYDSGNPAVVNVPGLWQDGGSLPRAPRRPGAIKNGN